MSSVASIHAPASPASRRAPSRAMQVVNLSIFLLGVIAIIVSVNFFSLRPEYRLQFDATKTRAYSLSDQTTQLLKSLEGEWALAVVMSPKNVDAAVRRQVDEVIKRFTDASKNITVLRIDPADPRSLTTYQRLISDLRNVYKGDVVTYDTALGAGVAAFEGLMGFARQQAPVLHQLVEAVPAEDPTRANLQQRANLLALLAEQGDRVLQEVQKARATDDAKPIADYETARSILAEALAQWAGQLDEIASLFSRWRERAGSEESVKRFAGAAAQSFGEMATSLATAADPLKRLEPLELSTIGQQLQQGEAIVVVGPKRAGIIPSWQLFPKNFRTEREGVVTFDQRFRGEQIIASTLRSLTVERLPKVIFVHAEDKSLLRANERNADLVGAAAMLKASRYEVAEWIVHQKPERPSVGRGQNAVWIVLPPTQRKSLQPEQNEQQLLQAVAQLISDGQNVLINYYPSLLTQYGQPDPWAGLAQPLGLRVDTSAVIYERMRIGSEKPQIQRGASLQDYNEEHVIGRAIAGQRSYFSLPLAITFDANQPDNRKIQALATIQRSNDRWAEKKWSTDPSQLPELSTSQMLQADAPLVVAVEQRRDGGQTQRVVAVGSAGWLLRFIADSVLSLGGGRAVLEYPGNYELLLASVAWLANMPELIAASPVSQGVARIQRVSAPELSFWRYFVTLGVPIICLGFGLLVHLKRR